MAVAVGVYVAEAVAVGFIGFGATICTRREILSTLESTPQSQDPSHAPLEFQI